MSLEAATFLSKDTRLKKIIAAHGEIKLVPRKKVYLRLCSSIMSQQLSVKVADVILGRFMQLFNGKEPSLHQILDIPLEQLRSVGLSNAKAQYVHHVCRFFVEQKLTDARLAKMSNDEVIACLTQIKGVGRWTTEMILMFTLAREDVFAVDDLGIQIAMSNLYNIDRTDPKSMKTRMLKQAQNWAPYRTYACMYLWRFKDTKAA